MKGSKEMMSRLFLDRLDSYVTAKIDHIQRRNPRTQENLESSLKNLDEVVQAILNAMDVGQSNN